MSMTKKDKMLLAKKDKKVKLQKATEMYKEGIERYHKARSHEEYEDAAESYTVAISLRPNNPKYYFARGNCFRTMLEFQRAFFDFSAAIRLDSTCASYYGNRGVCLRKLNQPTEAIQDFTTALKLAPADGNNYFNRALTYYEMGSVEEAIRDYTHAAKDFKYAFRAYYNRGNCYRKMGQLDDSIADLVKAVEIESSNAAGHNNLGLSHFEAGSLETAAGCFTDAIALDRNNGTYFNNRGLCHYHSGGEKLLDGLKDFEVAIKLDPEEASYFFNRGNARLGLALTPEPDASAGMEAAGKKKKKAAASNKPPALSADAIAQLKHDALADLEHAAALDSTSARFAHSIGLAWQQIGGSDQKAMLSFEQALRLDPGHLPSRYHLGLMLHKLEKHEHAVRAFGVVLQEVQNDPLVYESRGLVYQTLHQHQRAVEDFSAALLLMEPGTEGEDHYHRGESLLAMGRCEAALQDFDRACELGWRDAALFHARAMAKEALGDYQGAIDDFTVRALLARALHTALLPSCPCSSLPLLCCFARPAPVPPPPGQVALDLEDGNPKFLYERGQCYRTMGMAERAEEDLLRALDETPGEPRLLYGAGLAAYEQGKYGDAISHLNGVLEGWDEHGGKGFAPGVLADVHYHLGLANTNLGREQDAILCFSTAIDEAKDEKLRVGFVHERAKVVQAAAESVEDYEKAIEDFSDVIAYNPSNAHAIFRRGFAWKAAGDLDKAADDFENAKQLDPDNPNLVLNYSQAHLTDYVILCPAGEEPSFK